MRIVLAAFLIAGAALDASGAAAAAPVGFRVLEKRDPSRVSKDFPNGRPLQISVWYPASDAKAGAPIVFGDYVLLTATETAPGKPTQAAAAQTVKQYKAFLAQANVAAEAADAWLGTKMRATRDAPPAAGRAPLVLIAQGNGQSAVDQVFLAEHLAGRGFVVATLPSQAKIGGPMKSEREMPAQAEAQADDLAFAAKALRAEPYVRPGPYAVAGHSFGGRSALLLAMRDPEVAAVVSLDGGIGSKIGRGLLEKAKGFDRTRMKAPLLHLYEDGDRYMPVDLELVRSLASCDRWLVKVDAMRHVHFSTTGVMAKLLPGVAKATSATPQTAAAWDAVVATATSFLERFLRDSASNVRWSPPVSPLLHTVALRR